MAFPQVGAFGFNAPDWGAGLLERDWSKRDAATAREASERSAEAQMDFQRDMSNTAYRRAMEDMRLAGLNPMLAASQGGASSPSGSQFAAVPARGVNFPSVGMSQQMVTSAQVAKLNSEASLNEASADNVRAQTPTHAVRIEQMRQEIERSMAEINKIRQEERTSASQQFLNEQQKRNLVVEVDRIHATTKQLVAAAAASWAQERNLSAHETEIRQRIKANLPDLQRMAQELEIVRRKLEQPGQVQQSIVDDSYLGSWSRTLRAIFGQK